tara:strand:+ start:676 stop:1353 length:678 start_codon:yes stop_codon:yes gene_type:complete
MPAIYAIGLMIAFFALAIAEILIPSGGMIGLSAVVVAVTSIIVGYTYSSSMALTLTLVYVITTPILLALLIRFWPNTKIGRRMLNRATLESDSALPEPTTIDGTPLSQFIGRVGIATSNLLPSGEIKIDGHRSEAVSTGLPIDRDALVIVVRVQTGKLQVRAANEDEIRRWREDAAGVSPRTATTLPESIVPLASSTEQSVTSPLDDIDFDDLRLDEPQSDEHQK